MKKTYMIPAIELTETVASQMMALSLQFEPADDSTVLVEEESVLNIWEEE